MRKTRGFTLIELLVVIAIIGILSSVIIASLASARVKARDARRKSDLAQIQKAIELYKDDHSGSLPVTTGWCTQLAHPVYVQMKNALVPHYMPALPQDPSYANTAMDYYFRSDNGASGDYTLAAELDASDENSLDEGGCHDIPAQSNSANTLYDYSIVVR